MYRRHKYPTDFYEIIKNIYNKMTRLPGLFAAIFDFNFFKFWLSINLSWDNVRSHKKMLALSVQPFFTFIGYILAKYDDRWRWPVTGLSCVPVCEFTMAGCNHRKIVHFCTQLTSHDVQYESTFNMSIQNANYIKYPRHRFGINQLH